MVGGGAALGMLRGCCGKNGFWYSPQRSDAELMPQLRPHLSHRPWPSALY